MTAKGVEAFIWDVAKKMRRILDVLAANGVYPDSGWTLRYANSVTVNNGAVAVVGTGINPSGKTEAWRAVIGQ